ncbi:esterase [Paludibacter propionicigenes WB4]|uniref:Esterase n=1 Tax=Paludibacter propionicigenes (strain DSM 17365 / JCM 13257 / WB4) TaxID=694427 RepID=E4T4Z2_PALPW|nr:alpha/beta hydrolase-fold protein [Paludibacter propionicigenes]ADQ79786.1 esterase [Paludibacter propionicigenes WB4]
MTHKNISALMALFAFAFLFSGVASAQQTVVGKPAVTNINPDGFPRILDNLSVVFKIKAPDAKKMQIDLGKLYDMTKDDQGFWTVTTAPQVPGFHYYSLVIDGVKVVDPASETFYGTGRMSSAIDIPEKGVDFYDVKDVPHGALSSKYYFSKVTNSWRRLFVYTPAGYDVNTKLKYPVVYIQHGGGEDERGWAVQGKTDIILDNLIAEGKAKPMIVVISNGNVSASGGYTSSAMAAFKEEITNNVVPFIDKNFRTLADVKNRALCGLSMGGGQAFYAGLGSLDCFASVGVFSSGIFGGIANPTGKVFDADKEIPGLLTKAQQFNQKLKLFYVSVGEQDPRFEFTQKEVKKFQNSGLKVQFASFPGDHEWQVWRKSLHDFASRVFK